MIIDLPIFRVAVITLFSVLRVSPLSVAEKAPNLNKKDNGEPPYPLEFPEWYTSQMEGLARLMDFDPAVHDTVGKAIKAIAQATGLMIKFRDKAMDFADKKIQVPPQKRLPASSILDLILKFDTGKLYYYQTSQGIVVSDWVNSYPLPKEIMIRKYFESHRRFALLPPGERARQMAAWEKARKEGPEWVRKLREKLKSTKVTLDRKGVTLKEVLSDLNRQSGGIMLVDLEIDLSKEKVDKTFSGRSLEVVLNVLLHPRKLDFGFREGFLFISSAEKTKAHREDTTPKIIPQEDIRKAAAPLLERKINTELRGKRVHEIIGFLEDTFEISIYTCPETWRSKTVVPKSTVKMTLGQLLDLLNEKGIENDLMPVPLLKGQLGIDRTTILLITKPRGR
jgi:hypothetical protein